MFIDFLLANVNFTSSQGIICEINYVFEEFIKKGIINKHEIKFNEENKKHKIIITLSRFNFKNVSVVFRTLVNFTAFECVYYCRNKKLDDCVTYTYLTWTKENWGYFIDVVVR